MSQSEIRDYNNLLSGSESEYESESILETELSASSGDEKNVIVLELRFPKHLLYMNNLHKNSQHLRCSFITH